MKYGTIPNLSRPVSRMIFGTAHSAIFAAARSERGSDPDFPANRDRAFSLMDAAYEAGINAFDCAHHYGEEQLGDWMESRGLRDRVVVITKGAHHNAFRKRVTPFDILSDIHDSFAKLKTDHIDVYMLHRDDESVPVGEIMDTLARLHADGSVSAYGVSNWSTARIREAKAYAEKTGIPAFSVSSPYYGLAEQVTDPWGGGCISIAGPGCAEDRAWYRENGLPVIAYSALARGLFGGAFRAEDPEGTLSALDSVTIKGYFSRENVERVRRCEALAREKGCRVPDIALRYFFSRGEVDAYAVVSTGNPDHLRQNIAASEACLTQEECDYLDLARDFPR